MDVISYPVLYKTDSKGNVRQWNMDVEGNKYRTISGLKDGQLVTSTWKEAFAKNVGKANATTNETQAISEVESAYTNKKHEGYAEVLTEDNRIKPMLAATFKEFPENEIVYVQPKLDGIRCLVTPNGIISRNGKPIPAAEFMFKDLISYTKINNIVLDGELYNHEFHDDFNTISSLVRKQKFESEDYDKLKKYLQYHVYDIIDLNNLNSTFFERNSKIYNYNFENVYPVSTYKIQNKEQLDQYLMNFLEQGYEGAMVRLGNSVYEQKRSKNLLKYKKFQDGEFKILDVVEGKGNWSGMAKSIIIQLDNGLTCSSNMRGTQEFMIQMLKEKDLYIGGQATVRYMNITPDGVLRFPVAVALYRRHEERQ